MSPIAYRMNNILSCAIRAHGTSPTAGRFPRSMATRAVKPLRAFSVKVALASGRDVRSAVLRGPSLAPSNR